MDPEQERERREIHASLEAVHGPEIARKMARYMPIVPWEQLATKDDLAALEDRVRQRLDAVDARVDARFDQVDARFDQVDARFDQVDARFDRVEARLGQFHVWFDGWADRFERLATQVDALPSRVHLEALEHRVVAAFRGELVTAVSAQTRMLILAQFGTAVTLAALVLAVLRFA